MLPPNFLTIPQIQHERHAGSKLMHLTVLLEYLLKLCNPNVTAAETGKDPKVGERILADKHLFNDFTRVLWALRVRNSFAHVTGNEFTERDHQNAVNCLIEAIGDVCKQPAIPYEIKQAIYRDPDADFHARQAAEDQRRKEEQVRIEREKRAHEEQARKLRAEQERLEEGRRQHARREKDIERKAANRVSIVYGLRGALVLTVLAAVGYFSWPQVNTWIKGNRQTAAVVRTQAELALKKVKLKKKQTEYGAFIIQADAAWRDGEIEFKKGYYKVAEEKYRQVLSLWDGVNARMAETQSFDELQTEMNSLRATAMNAPTDAVGNTDTAGGGPVVATPTATLVETPEPVRPSPTAFVQPTLERVNPPSSGPSNDSDDDGIFTINEKEFRRYITRQVPAVISAQARAADYVGLYDAGVDDVRARR